MRKNLRILLLCVMKLRRFFARVYVSLIIYILCYHILFYKTYGKTLCGFHFTAGDRGRLWVFAALSDWLVVFDPISCDVTPSHAADRD